MGDWPTETGLSHQVMRKLVGHDGDTYGPFQPRIDDADASRRHFEILRSLPIATAEGGQCVHGTLSLFANRKSAEFSRSANPYSETRRDECLTDTQRKSIQRFRHKLLRSELRPYRDRCWKLEGSPNDLTVCRCLISQHTGLRKVSRPLSD